MAFEIGSMPQRNLGSLKVSQQGFGCMSLNSFIYKTDIDETGAIELVRHAIKLGVTHFDTALIYGPYKSEITLGKAIQGYPREKLVIATKTGFNLDDGFKVDGRPELIRRTCNECLERLQVSYIDLFYLHRIDTKVPIEESMQELKKLVEEGKIKHIGLSEASADTIRRAHAVHPITAVQIEWSLWTRDVEADVVPACRELGIGIVAYSPMGRGLLAAAFETFEDIPANDWRRQNPRFTKEAFEKNKVFSDRVRAFAAKKGCSPGQVSLAWVMAQGNDVCPIPGTSKIAHLEDNVKANDIRLTPEELNELSSLVPPEEVSGDRYSEGSNTFKSN